jgi:hypothetical protein
MLIVTVTGTYYLYVLQSKTHAAHGDAATAAEYTWLHSGPAELASNMNLLRDTASRIDNFSRAHEHDFWGIHRMSWQDQKHELEKGQLQEVFPVLSRSDRQANKKPPAPQQQQQQQMHIDRHDYGSDRLIKANQIASQLVYLQQQQQKEQQQEQQMQMQIDSRDYDAGRVGEASQVAPHIGYLQQQEPEPQLAHSLEQSGDVPADHTAAGRMQQRSQQYDNGTLVPGSAGTGKGRSAKVKLKGEAEYLWVFHNSDGGFRYNHMATSEVLPGGILIVAWQRGRVAEGLDDQELVRAGWNSSLLSCSSQGGRTSCSRVAGNENGSLYQQKQ